MLNLPIPYMIVYLAAILTGLTIHEYSHAFAAVKLGDDTPKERGRFTLNPLKHIDLLGFVFLMIAGFGWAKPVVINRNNLQKPVFDGILISLAGPFSNLLFALILGVILKGLTLLPGFDPTGKVTLFIINSFSYFILINLGLGIFNLLPFPPLDGSHLYLDYLMEKVPSIALNIYRAGGLVLVALLVARRFVGIDLLPIGRLIQGAYEGMFGMLGLLP